jgi:hypothetical protein
MAVPLAKDRPAAIWWFDALMLASMLLSAIDIAVNWAATEAQIAADLGAAHADLVVVLAFGSVAIGFGLYLLLWFFVSVRASKIAKWILALMALISLASITLVVAVGGDYREFWLGISSNLALVAAATVLFLPGASPWFNPQVSPSVFE